MRGLTPCVSALHQREAREVSGDRHRYVPLLETPVVLLKDLLHGPLQICRFGNVRTICPVTPEWGRAGRWVFLPVESCSFVSPPS